MSSSPPRAPSEGSDGDMSDYLDQWSGRPSLLRRVSAAVHSARYPIVGMQQQGINPMLLMAASTLSSQAQGAFNYSPEYQAIRPGPPIFTSNIERSPLSSNIFVFHLPSEMTNWDLYLLFRRFGTLLSVNIMVKRQTGLSRGYGFISFASPADAATAIAQMDGFRLGAKRLKVELKRENREYIYASYDEEEKEGLESTSSF